MAKKPISPVEQSKGCEGLSSCCHAACSCDENGHYCKQCYSTIKLIPTTDPMLSKAILDWVFEINDPEAKYLKLKELQIEMGL